MVGSSLLEALSLFLILFMGSFPSFPFILILLASLCFAAGGLMVADAVSQEVAHGSGGSLAEREVG